MSETTARPPARAHHLRFKYALVTRALEEPSSFVELCMSPSALAELWNAIGSALPEEERIDGRTLAARNAGDLDHPVLMVTFPPPERPNEAYHVCALPMTARPDANGSLHIPDADGPIALRMFGLERSILPDGGLIGFVVEWTAAVRHNYDAPDNASPAAFWKAILEIFGGTRVAVHTLPMPNTRGTS